MEKTIIGIDLGGTNLRIGAVAEDSRILSFSKIRSNRIAMAADPLQELINVIDEFVKENKIDNIQAISMGVPSSVANDNKTVICTTNIQDKDGNPVFQNRNIADDISKYFQVPVYINNDTNNILLYDVMANHLDPNAINIGIYIGTGVGAAVMIDGKLLNGRDGAALDLGHIPYFNGDVPCSCGKTGCCECYASGWRLEKIREEYFPDTEIGDLFVKHGNEHVMKEFIGACANVFAIMATIFNPEVMVAGGGVVEMPGFLKQEFEHAVNEATGKDVMSYGFRYVYSKETDTKGVIGAALFARWNKEI